MKKRIINKCINIIEQNKDYDEIKINEIKYGLEGIYLMITKLTIISLIAIFLNIFIEFIIFFSIYSIIRMPSFGIHASKSWICLIASTIIFIGIPLLIKNITVNIYLRLSIGFISTLHINFFSPADTYKKPIINEKRRKIYKTISTIISCIYIILAITIRNNFISNCFLFATILQNILISPITYKLCNQPYNNYKNYIIKNGLN